jgi:hypothetical protein
MLKRLEQAITELFAFQMLLQSRMFVTEQPAGRKVLGSILG